MFDKNYYPGFPSSVDVTVRQTVTHGPKTVTEIRAPTDDSIRILNEMREKTLQDIISRLRIDDNIFKCHAVMVSDHQEWQNRIVVKYSYNGHERVVRFSFDQGERDLQKITGDLRKKVAEDFTEVIMTSVLFDTSNQLLNLKYR
jgi:hypothetical protein